VTAGPGLTGGADSGDVALSLADAGVTGAKIANGAVNKERLSATGGVAGQLLSLDTNGLVWRDLLPYAGLGLSATGRLVLRHQFGSGRAMTAAALFEPGLIGASGTGRGYRGRLSPTTEWWGIRTPQTRPGFSEAVTPESVWRAKARRTTGCMAVPRPLGKRRLGRERRRERSDGGQFAAGWGRREDIQRRQKRSVGFQQPWSGCYRGKHEQRRRGREDRRGREERRLWSEHAWCRGHRPQRRNHGVAGFTSSENTSHAGCMGGIQAQDLRSSPRATCM